jgi:hypothetical protein
MLLTFILIQLAMNVAILTSLIRLVQERTAYAVEARRREERLESLAAELCAVGREVARQGDPVSNRPPISVSGGPGVRDPGIQPEQPPATPPASPVPADRFQGAVRMLQQGVAVESLAGETTLLEGELQVLRNLTRGAAPNKTVRRVGRVGMGSRRETSGESRRHAGGGRSEGQGGMAPAERTTTGARHTHEAHATEVAR